MDFQETSDPWYNTGIMQLDHPPENQTDVTKMHPLFARYKKFEEGMNLRAETTTPEQIIDTLTELERYSQSPDRTIEVYTDPRLDTWCCAEVPAKRITPEGEIVDESGKKTYLIGVPLRYLAGRASNEFMLGEICHEQGHALYSDFGRMTRLRVLAHNEGYDPKEILATDNCCEDPRQERVYGGPTHPVQRKLLFEKNASCIVPNIAMGLPTMSPPDQFRFLLKLEGLWAVYSKDFEEIGVTEKPWKLENLSPDVVEEYQKVAPVLSEITGDHQRPAIKISAKVEQMMVNDIWPAQKRLIDKYPARPGEGKKGGGKCGQPSPGGEPGEDAHFNPADPSTWPEHLKPILQKFMRLHQQRLEKKAESAKNEAERKKIADEQREKALHAIQKSRDGFEDPKMRALYDARKNRLRPQILHMKRVYQSQLPEITEPEKQYGRRGKNFSVTRLIRRFGTGHEQPLGKNVDVEKVGLVLQIEVDVSGSMKKGERIQNAVDALIITGEAAEDRPIAFEILAHDDKNFTTENVGWSYVIKAFDEPWDGKVKTRVIAMLTAFGGENQDAAAIRAGLPRIKRQIKKMRAEADRTGALIIYISDSETKEEDTRKAAEESRRVVPLEGTAITSEPEIAAQVKFHFGPDSLIPPNVQAFPTTFQKILQRHLVHLRSRH